jgi:hypothetical protein
MGHPGASRYLATLGRTEPCFKPAFTPKRTGNRQRGQAIAGRRAVPDTNVAREPIVTEAA